MEQTNKQQRRKQPKPASSGGFQRGFLLQEKKSTPTCKKPPTKTLKRGFLLDKQPSSRSKRRSSAKTKTLAEPKKTVLNHDLLGFEKEEEQTKRQKTSFLMVSDEDHTEIKDTTIDQDEIVEKTLLPLHLTLEDKPDNDDGFRIEAISTRRNTTKRIQPLIQEVEMSDRMNGTAQDAGHGLDQNSNASELLTERETKPIIEPLITQVEIKKKSGSLVSEVTHSASIEKEDVNSLSLELSRFLWKLRRQGKPSLTENTLSPTAVSFVDKHLHSESQWVYVWDAILEVCAQECTSNLKCTRIPEVQLGMIMLTKPEGLDSLATFLSPTLEKRSRILALGAALLLHGWLQQNGRQIDFAKLVALLDKVLVPLTDLVVDSACKRTVLSHWCMVLSYELVTVASQQAANDSSLLESVWKVIDLIQKQWEVQQNWLIQGNSSLSVENGNLTSAVTADVARKQCTLAVLTDWRRLTKHCQREYQELCLGGQNRNDSATRVTQYWCGQASGVQIAGIDGGATIGSLARSLCLQNNNMEPATVVASLETAVELMQSTSEESNPQEIVTCEYQQRAILRGVVAWLGQSKKHLRQLAKTFSEDASNNRLNTDAMDTGGSGPPMLERAMELSMNLLRSKSTDCTDMVLAMLNYLWSDSEGLPPDLFDLGSSDVGGKSDTLPASFGLLIDELRRSTMSKEKMSSTAQLLELDPSARALCIIISRCILRKGTHLLTSLVAQNGLCDSTVEILEMVLLADDGSNRGTSDGGDKKAVSEEDAKGSTGPGNGSLSLEAGKVLLKNIQSNACVRQKLQNSPRLLSGLPIEITVPKLLEALSGVLGVSSASADAVNSAVATCLTYIMETNLAHAEKMIVATVNALINIDENDGSGLPKDSVNKICSKFAGNWRRSLLSSSICGDEGFAKIMVAIGNVMFAMPSKSAPLTLLGAVLGDGVVLLKLTRTERQRVFNVSAALLDLSLCEMQSPKSQAETTEGAAEDSRLFRQLSPLLLLRRIPTSYFRAAFQGDDSISDGKSEKFRYLLDDLCSQLAVRLDIENRKDTDKPVFTADERRLSAEIAGRCLPFYIPSGAQTMPSPSCFDRICVPAFGGALRELKTNHLQTVKNEPMTEAIRTARAALYAACHHIPVADGSDEGEGILAVASFALNVLAVETNADVTESEDEDIIQLQTGCIEFFAICLESTLQRHLEKQGSGEPGGFVTEVIQRGEVSRDKTESCETSRSTLQALNDISCSLRTILKTGSTSHSWVRMCKAWFGASLLSTGNSSVSFSPSARTCLWNSFLVTSQRIPEQNGKLAAWSRTTLQWVLDWGSGGSIDLDLRHPLCMAAALQASFVLITRTKSLDCLSQNKDSGVRKAHKWALESVKYNSRQGGEYAVATMRMAGLKLMLAIVSIDQISNEDSAWQGCLSPGELGETFSVLQGAANMDADSNVRKLASHVLGAMRMGVR